MTRSTKDRFRILNRASAEKTPVLAALPDPKTADGVAQLRLYDVIDSWGGPYGVAAREFAEVLDALPDSTTEIHLHINSPGGEVWEGLAIMNLLRQHQAKVVAIVDGIAASAASFVACGADELAMAPNSELMVHSPWGVCVGNAVEMAKVAEDLAHEADNMASIYAKKSGGTPEEWLAVMAAETWFSDVEAVSSGLADRILDDAPPADEQAKARFDLSVFAYAGREKAPAPAAMSAAPKTPVAPSASGSTTTAQEDTMSLSDAVRERLGIADENADEDTILAALDEALNEQATDTPTPTPAATPPADVVNPAALAEITRLSSELAEVRARQAKREKDELFAAWLRDGKTTPAEINAGKPEGLEAMYDAAPAQTKALVDARAKGSVVPVSLIGVNSSDEESEDDRMYADLFGPEKVS